MKTNDAQRAAIRQLKRALNACGASGVQLFGMDSTLYATVSHDPAKDFHENYQEPEASEGADRMETIIMGGVYIGSGGW